MQTAAPMSSPCTMGYRGACRPPTTRPGGGRHSRSSRRSSRRARRRLNLARLSRFAAALLLGMVSGALFLGVGGRLVMHAFALATAQSAGFTLRGSLNVVFAGAIGGAIRGLRLAANDPLLPPPRAPRAAGCAAPC